MSIQHNTPESIAFQARHMDRPHRKKGEKVSPVRTHPYFYRIDWGPNGGLTILQGSMTNNVVYLNSTQLQALRKWFAQGAP